MMLRQTDGSFTRIKLSIKDLQASEGVKPRYAAYWRLGQRTVMFTFTLSHLSQRANDT